jgi:transposase
MSDTTKGGSRAIKPFEVNVMPGHRYSEEFKQQALALVARRDQPATQIAQQLGIPRRTLYKWREAARQHPAEPCVGSGQLRSEDQQHRDLQRQRQDLREENAVLK